MTTIYQPKGAAREYAELACNLYTGCSHGCLYCYAPACRRLTREAFANHVQPYPNILKRLEKDADAMAAAGDTRRVLFSFTSDPYQQFAPGCDVTREALQIMVDRGLQFEVCTKGGTRAERDFDLLQQGGRLGVSLVHACQNDCDKWEPYAAGGWNRLESLKDATELGIYTWVSIEPALNVHGPRTVIHYCTLESCANEYRVGKINHDAALSAAVDWQAFVDELYPLLETTGRRFLIKQSLHPYLLARAAAGGPTP